MYKRTESRAASPPLPPLATPHTSLQIFIPSCKTFEMLFILLHRTCVQHAARQRQSMCRCVWEAAGQPHDVSDAHSDQSHQPLVALQRRHHHRIPRQRTRWVSRTPRPRVFHRKTVWASWWTRCGARARTGRLLSPRDSDLAHRSAIPARGEDHCQRSLRDSGINCCYLLKQHQSIYFEDVWLPQSPYGELSFNDLITRAKSFLDTSFKSCSSSATTCHASETSHLRTMFSGCFEAASVVQQTFSVVSVI